MIRAALITLILIFSATTTRAEPDFITLNTALAEIVLIPAYDQLSISATDQNALWLEVCENPAAEKLATLRAAFRRTSDAWAGVFNWNFGPITFLLRRDRFYHWPERRNAISKGLARLLDKTQPEKLHPAVFARTSVAVQGLPALERLLFENVDVMQNKWACRVGQAIAGNLASMAMNTSKEWRTEVLQHIKTGKPHPIYFGAPKELLNTIFTGLLTGYTIITDQKLRPVLGGNTDKAKPKLIEGRRSKRFLSNLKLNLTALFRIDAVIGAVLSSETNADMKTKKGQILPLLEELMPPEVGVYDSKQRDKITELIRRLTDYQTSIVDIYSKHLGLVVGFNSLDGD